MATDEPVEIKDAGASIIATLQINVVICVVVLLIFVLIRPRVKQWLYEMRFDPQKFVVPPKQNGWKRPPDTTQGLFGWVWPALTAFRTNSELASAVGLDACVVTMFYRLCVEIMAVLTLVGCIVLMPTNRYAGTADAPGIDTLSLSNVIEGDYLYIHLVTTYVFFFFIAWRTFGVYVEYVKLRHEFLEREVREGRACTVLVRDVPVPLRSEPEMEALFSEVFPKQPLAAYIARDTSAQLKLAQQRLQLAKNIARAEEIETQSGVVAQMRKTKLGCLPVGEKTSSISYYRAQLLDKTAEVKALDPPSVWPHALVTFFGSSTTALTTHSSPSIVRCDKDYPLGSLGCELAPEPRDLQWSQLRRTDKERAVRGVVGRGLTYTLMLFWTIPVAFITTLTSLDNLMLWVPFLKPMMSWHPSIVAFLEGFLPGLALIIFNAILPLILFVIADVQGVASFSEREMSMMNKYFSFQVFNNFLVISLAGTALNALDAMIENPTQIPIILATSIPSQATFYINYMILAFTALAITLLNPGGLILGWWGRRAKTTVDLNAAAPGVHFLGGVFITQALFVFLVAVVYSSITPLILPFALAYFGMNYLVRRYQAVYFFVQDYESGGRFWPSIFTKIVACLFIAHVVIIGMFALRTNITVTGLALPLLVLDLGYWYYVQNHLYPLSLYLPLQRCVEIDGELRASSIEEGKIEEGKKEGKASPYAKYMEAMVANCGYPAGEKDKTRSILEPEGAEVGLLEEVNI